MSTSGSITSVSRDWLPPCLQKCRSGFLSLFSLFQEKVPASAASQRSLVGSVQNVGSSCALSSLLQELATDAYKPLLDCPLQQRSGESNSCYRQRVAAQLALKAAVEKIDLGKTVQKSEIWEIGRLLHSLGWQGEFISYWKISWSLLLNRLAPSIFPLPQLPNPHDLYEIIALSLFDERIVLSAQNPKLSLRQFMEQSPSFKQIGNGTIWRVIDPKNTPSEQFQIKNIQFSLKVVHVRIENHVVAYRKLGKSWICCDDEKVINVERLPSRHIYGLVYACRIL